MLKWPDQMGQACPGYLVTAQILHNAEKSYVNTALPITSAVLKHNKEQKSSLRPCVAYIATASSGCGHQGTSVSGSINISYDTVSV
jgi:hypothetical protein